MDHGDKSMFITKTEWDSDQHLKKWVADLFRNKISTEIKDNTSGI